MVQNKLARFLNNAKISDRKTTKSLLANLNMLSVNQLNGQIKLSVIWKAVHLENYPVKVSGYELTKKDRISRSIVSGKLKDYGKSELVKSSFKSDGIRLWNNCPDKITKCNSLFTAKKKH